MLVVMRHGASEDNIQKVIDFIKSKGYDAHVSRGDLHTVIGAVGGKVMDPRDLELLDGVKDNFKL